MDGWGEGAGGLGGCKGKGERGTEDKRERKCNPIPRKRESLSPLEGREMETFALGRPSSSYCSKQPLYEGKYWKVSEKIILEYFQIKKV